MFTILCIALAALPWRVVVKTPGGSYELHFTSPVLVVGEYLYDRARAAVNEWTTRREEKSPCPVTTEGRPA